MRTFLPFVLFGILLQTSGCDNPDTYLDIQRDVMIYEFGSGTPERYVEHVNKGRVHARRRQWERAEHELQAAADVMIHEGLNYDIWIELAQAQCYLGKSESALSLLDDFNTALKLNFGSERCFFYHPETRMSSPNPNLSERAFGAVCSEDVESSRITFGNEREKKAFSVLEERRQIESALLRRHCASLAG